MTPYSPTPMGKKVFFLYPHSVIQQDVLEDVMRWYPKTGQVARIVDNL